MASDRIEMTEEGKGSSQGEVVDRQRWKGMKAVGKKVSTTVEKIGSLHPHFPTLRSQWPSKMEVAQLMGARYGFQWIQRNGW